MINNSYQNLDIVSLIQEKLMTQTQNFVGH